MQWNKPGKPKCQTNIHILDHFTANTSENPPRPSKQHLQYIHTSIHPPSIPYPLRSSHSKRLKRIVRVPVTTSRRLLPADGQVLIRLQAVGRDPPPLEQTADGLVPVLAEGDDAVVVVEPLVLGVLDVVVAVQCGPAALVFVLVLAPLVDVVGRVGQARRVGQVRQRVDQLAAAGFAA